MSYTVAGYLRRVAVLLSVLLLSVTPAVAQLQTSQNQDGFESMLYDGNLKDTPERDSTVIQREVPKEFSQYLIVFDSPYHKEVGKDTLMYLFQNSYKTGGDRLSYNTLGNIGSERQSRIFSERTFLPSFMFDEPYSYFVKNPTDFRFTDTKTPHLNIAYYSGGGSRNGDDRLKGYFAANFGKKAGIGLDMDYVYGRGRYSNQATSLFDTRCYLYFRSDIYSVHFNFNTDNIKLAENGGITDDDYINNPEKMAEGKKVYEPEEIPVRLKDTWNELGRNQFLLSQRLSLGSNYMQADTIGDTIIYYKKFNEMARIANNSEFGIMSRKFIEYSTPKGYYEHDFLNNDSTDGFKNVYFKNTLSLSMNEGFSKWAVAGLRVFATYELRNFTMADTLIGGRSTEYDRRVTESDFSIGGAIERNKGTNFNIGASAQTVLLGAHFSDFKISGEARLDFNLLKKPAGFTARAYVRGDTPGYFVQHFHSQHHWWDVDMKKEINTHVEGELHIDRLHTRITAGFSNISNYTYFADLGETVSNASGLKVLKDIYSCQAANEIQVLDATLYQDFVLGPLHWDNRVTWQYTSDKDILPLPMLDIFTDIYIKFTYFKRLKLELGCDANWFTKYCAPDFSPAVGQFHLQNPLDRIEIGNYPAIDVYLNCEIRGVRFFVMGSHINSGMYMTNSAGPFLAPHYPINPRMFRFGLSWTLFD